MNLRDKLCAVGQLNTALVIVALISLLSACGGGGDTAITTKSERDPFEGLVQVAEVEVNDTPGQADSIVTEVVGTGAINATGDEDWYRFYSSGGVHRLTARVGGTLIPGTIQNWDFRVYDTADNLLTMVSIEPEETVALNLQITTPGNYYVSVTYGNSWTFSRNPYFVLVQDLASDQALQTEEIEPNNALSEADELEMGMDKEGRIGATGDQDWYRFYSMGGVHAISARVGGEVTPGVILDWDFVLHDSSGTPLYTLSLTEEDGVTVNVDLPAQGNYYISVAYGLSWTFQNSPYYLTVTPR